MSNWSEIAVNQCLCYREWCSCDNECPRESCRPTFDTTIWVGWPSVDRERWWGSSWTDYGHHDSSPRIFDWTCLAQVIYLRGEWTIRGLNPSLCLHSPNPSLLLHSEFRLWDLRERAVAEAGHRGAVFAGEAGLYAMDPVHPDRHCHCPRRLLCRRAHRDLLWPQIRVSTKV